MKQLRQRFWHWKHRKQDRWWTWTHYCVASPGEWGITWTCAPTTSQRNHSTQAWQAWAAKRQLHFQEAPQHEWQLTKAVFFFLSLKCCLSPPPPLHASCGSQRMLESVFFFQLVGSIHQTQVIRTGNKHLYPLSQFTCSEKRLLDQLVGICLIALVRDLMNLVTFRRAWTL